MSPFGRLLVVTHSRARGMIFTQRAIERESVMTPRGGKAFCRSQEGEDLRLTHAHAAGIDVHAAVHFVAVPPASVPEGFHNPDSRLPKGVRKFGATTGDLEALAAWLKDCQVKAIAMRALKSSRRFVAVYLPPPSGCHYSRGHE